MLENAIDYCWQLNQLRRKHAQEALEQGRSAVYPESFGSGMLPGDKLRPVITIVVFWGTEPWKGPRTLQELMDLPPELKSVVDNNKLIIVAPVELTEEQAESCDSSLEYVLGFLRRSHDKAALEKYLAEHKVFQALDAEAAHVIETVSNSGIPLPKKYEKGDKVNMCQAIADMLSDATRASQEKIDALQTSYDALQMSYDALQTSLREKEAELAQLRAALAAGQN